MAITKPGRGNVLVARVVANRGQRGRCPSRYGGESGSGDVAPPRFCKCLQYVGSVRICVHTKPSLTAETPHLSCNGFAARLPNSDDIPVPQIDPSCAAFSQLQTNDACDETASVETHPSAGIFHTTRFADYGDAYLPREFPCRRYLAANLTGKF